MAEETQRTLLVDWLVVLQCRRALAPETLFLAVRMMDAAFGEGEGEDDGDAMLVAAAALWTASKYEEVDAVSLDECRDIADGLYSRDEFEDAEARLLRAVGFELARPTPRVLASRALEGAVGGDDAAAVENVAYYLLELALYHREGAARFSCARLAEGAVLAALRAVRGPGAAWPGRDETEVRPAAAWLAALHRRARTEGLRAVHKKYASRRFGRVAIATQPDSALADEGDRHFRPPPWKEKRTPSSSA